MRSVSRMHQKALPTPKRTSGAVRSAGGVLPVMAEASC
jgi:hypothetical protein